MSFVHLHNHTHYSLLDGLSRPRDCAKIAKSQGSPAIAITDHGVLYGAIEFYKACREEGIKPIIGCEIYVAPEGRLKKEPGTAINHLTVLAETTEGYHNLMQLMTKAHLEGFYYKPRVDHGLLRSYSKGLIVLSGCLKGEIAEAFSNDNEKKAHETLELYRDIFGAKNFFIELQDHPNMQNQILLNRELIRLAKKTGSQLVATNDNHYSYKEDRDVHDILLCIQTNKKVQDRDRMKYEDDFSIRPPEEIIAAFADCPEAIANTLAIADRCNVEIACGANLIPHFNTPNNMAPQEYLRELCEDGLKERFGNKVTSEMEKRLSYELDIIHKAGFDTYFLIVHDFVRFSRERGVIVGPGRGSAAGSFVAYCLGITTVDPLAYGLLFERFLNPARVSMPDIDIDFDDERRDEVLDYVINKYGRDKVAQIITFGTMAARAAVRDTGRAMGYPYDEVDRLAKLVPPPVQGRHIPLKKSIGGDPELKKAYEGDPRAKALLDNAIRLEGTIRHAGTHACAVVISDKPLTDYTPLQKTTGDDAVITQYSMKPLEELGLLKIDLLGLKNLTVIRETLATIERVYGKKIDIDSIPPGDKKTYALLAAGETTGVFQMESSGMRRYLKDLKPTEFNDITAMISLYRPGPMHWIPMYIRGKHTPQSVSYIHSSFESILKETYGVAVYQEQILEIARDFAGFSLGEADILRKAVGKKDPRLLAGEREKFVQGASSKGHSRKFAEHVFEKVIEPFAAYGFNKSHATCYAMIAYQTAYLKANYPAAFMAALLTADSGNEDRIAIEVTECESMGIAVLPPDINESLAHFTVVPGNKIRFGLKAIKGLGDQPIAAIIAAREKGGLFAALEDFFKKAEPAMMNKKVIEALAYSGALDSLGERKAIAASVEEIVHFIKQLRSSDLDGQTDIFEMLGSDSLAGAKFMLKRITPATRVEQLQWEKEFLGLYVSGHPLQGLKKYLAKKAHAIGMFTEKEVGRDGIKLCGIITRVKRVLTKSGMYMAYCVLEDLTGRQEIVVFPKIYETASTLLAPGQAVVIEGKLEYRNDNPQFICRNIQEISLESMVNNARDEGLFDENEKYIRVAEKAKVAPEGRINCLASLRLGLKEESAIVQQPFVIELTEKMDEDALAYLKKLLNSNRGGRKVELRISTNEGKKRISVPFGVDVTPELRRQIEEVAK